MGSGIAERRERSEAKRITRSLSILIVPVKAANFTQKEPVEGRGIPC